MSVAKQVKREVRECPHLECDDSNCWLAPQGLHHACECVEPVVCPVALSEPEEVERGEDIALVELPTRAVVHLDGGTHIAVKIDWNSTCLREEHQSRRVNDWFYRQMSAPASLTETLAFLQNEKAKRKAAR